MTSSSQQISMWGQVLACSILLSSQEVGLGARRRQSTPAPGQALSEVPRVDRQGSRPLPPGLPILLLSPSPPDSEGSLTQCPAHTLGVPPPTPLPQGPSRGCGRISHPPLCTHAGPVVPTLGHTSVPGAGRVVWKALRLPLSSGPCHPSHVTFLVKPLGLSQAARRPCQRSPSMLCAPPSERRPVGPSRGNPPAHQGSLPEEC